MTADLDFNRLVAGWLAEASPREMSPTVVQAAVATSRRVAQRRGVRAWLLGPVPWPELAGHIRSRTVRRGLRLVLVAMLMVALIGAAAYVGSRLLHPRPARLLGVIEPTGSMLGSRFVASGTLLEDGRVLVSGATGTDEVVAAEVYDPQTGQFSAAASMDVGRAPGRVNAQLALADGRVLIVGSTGGQASGLWPYTPFLRIFDPTTGTMSATGPPPVHAFANGLLATLRADGRVELLGSTGSGPLLYDPATGSVSSAADSGDDDPDASDIATVRLADGRTMRLFDRPVLEPAAEIVDEATGRRVELPRPPVVAGGTRTLTLLDDGRVLVLGQSNAVFDPSTMTFTSLHGPVLRPLVTLSDGRLLLDGRSPTPFGDDPDPGLWTFDSTTSTLERLPLVWPSTCCAAWTALADGRVLGFGGFDGEVPTSNAWLIH